MNSHFDIIFDILSFVSTQKCLKYSLLSTYHKASIIKILEFRKNLLAEVPKKINSPPYYSKVVAFLRAHDSDISNDILVEFTNLKSLNVDNCENISGEALFKLKKLKTLRIGPNNTNILEKDIDKLVWLDRLDIPMINVCLTHYYNYKTLYATVTNMHIIFPSSDIRCNFIKSKNYNYEVDTYNRYGFRTHNSEKYERNSNKKALLLIRYYMQETRVPLQDVCGDICGLYIKNNKCAKCNCDVTTIKDF